MSWLTFIPGKAVLVGLFKAARRRVTEETEDVGDLPNARIVSATEELNQIADDVRDTHPPHLAPQRIVTEATTTAPNQSTRQFPSNRSLQSDEYQLYLVKTYQIEKSSALGKYVVNGELFASIDDALSYAHTLDLAAERHEVEGRVERAPIRSDGSG
jgi:hypothetical protein